MEQLSNQTSDVVCELTWRLRSLNKWQFMDLKKQCLPREQHIWSLVETVLKPAAKRGLLRILLGLKRNEENMYLL